MEIIFIMTSSPIKFTVCMFLPQENLLIKRNRCGVKQALPQVAYVGLTAHNGRLIDMLPPEYPP